MQVTGLNTFSANRYILLERKNGTVKLTAIVITGVLSWSNSKNDTAL
jgi:hypothetical protein